VILACLRESWVVERHARTCRREPDRPYRRQRQHYFAHDAAGRLLSTHYADVAPVYFAYDRGGNRTLMQDEWGATYWSYDVLGRPKEEEEAESTNTAPQTRMTANRGGTDRNGNGL
jgi:YD repeat-containing protein